MRKLLLISALLLGLAIGSQGQGFVQAVYSTNAYGTPVNLPSMTVATAGDLLVVYGTLLTGVSNTGIAAQSWTACPALTDVGCYYAVASTTGVIWTSVTKSSSANSDVAQVEFSGVNSPDVHNSATGSGTALTVTSSSVSSASECVLGIGGTTNASNPAGLTAGSGYTLVGDGSYYAWGEWKCGTSLSGAQTAGITLGVSRPWYMDVITFQTALPTAGTPSFSFSTAYFLSSISPMITSLTSGATIIYTTDGSTPGTSSGCTPSGTGTAISNGSSITVTTTETVKAIACKSAYTNSAVTSVIYTVLTDTSVASDAFTSPAYYNANLGSGANLAGVPYQLPLDLWETASAWQNIGSTGYAVVEPDSIRGGSNMMVEGALAAAVIERTNEGYYQNQASRISLEFPSTAETTNAIGVTDRCTTSHCYYLTVQNLSSASSTINFGDFFGSVLGTYTAGFAYTGSHVLELRVTGCDFQPLIDGASVQGMSIDYTEGGCSTSGQPGLYVAPLSTNLATVYNWSGYNIGGSASGYTPPSLSYQTYSSAFNTSSFTVTNPPWYPYSVKISGTNYWPGNLGSVANGSGYAVGITNTGTADVGAQSEYRAYFGVNQWLAATINVNVFDSRFTNYFTPLLHQSFVPGLLNGGCAAAGTMASCYDPAAVYFGEEPMNQASFFRTTACAEKAEYCGTPYWHVTTVDPTNSAGNQVNTLTGSTTALMNTDMIVVQMNGGYADAYCKQGTPPPSWSSGMTIAAGTTYIEGAGMIWLASTSGTAGSTQPVWPTSASWSTTTYTGTTVSDGSGAWMYWGDTCPSTAVYTRIMHAYFPYLSNPASTTGLTQALGTGFPAIWGGGAAVPLYSNVSMGTIGYGTGNPCGVGGGPSGTCIAPSVTNLMPAMQW
jgi:hypothetical protein